MLMPVLYIGLEPSELHNEELLKNALEESIKHLPSGYIKTKLEKDFDKYYEILKRYVIFYVVKIIYNCLFNIL